jgi:hypothetical protein
MDAERIRIIRLHQRWADGYTLLWQCVHCCPTGLELDPGKNPARSGQAQA